MAPALLAVLLVTAVGISWYSITEDYPQSEPPVLVTGLPPEEYMSEIGFENDVYLVDNRVFINAGYTLRDSCEYVKSIELTSPTDHSYPQDIVLVINIDSEGEICLMMLGGGAIMGEIKNLDPGEYNISAVEKRGSTLINIVKETRIVIE